MMREDDIRREMRKYTLAEDGEVLAMLQQGKRVSSAHREAARQQAVLWIEAMRARKSTGVMDIFMAEYGLSNAEGIALMCLAEALLRVPDPQTIDALIEDKIAPSNWSSHLGRSSSPLVNASTWGLLLTGRLLDDDRPLAGILHGLIKRVGEPVIRAAVKRAMRELGAQFVLGQTIDEAMENGREARKAGYSYSYDMLGEAAQTADDALGFFHAYADAIEKLSHHAQSTDIRENPGISIKLSALFERYELTQKDRVMKTLVPRVLLLAQMAKRANMGLNIDAEEAARLELSMDVIEAVLADSSLAGWDGFGIVVQAYGKRARFVIDWFYTLAKRDDRRVMLRLVKGAYWDTEIKLAQVEGLQGFPVFTSKQATDVSYAENAAHLLSLSEVIYPQFATHNAHSVAMIKALAGDFQGYEFQRLHGMGDALYGVVQETGSLRCRIYAPVGVHEDLLAYLVRRLLENGANSSFVHQILDHATPVHEVAADPYENLPKSLSARILHPRELFTPRKNSQGFDLSDCDDLAKIDSARAGFAQKQWRVESKIVGTLSTGEILPINSPATDEAVGSVRMAGVEDCATALKAATVWQASTEERAKILCKAADLYEKNFGEVFAILAREAGKTPLDALAEIREAVDFLRFYAEMAQEYHAAPKGIFCCISPWNFPLAIFTGQIAAALAAGNGVVAKPAETTSIMASRAVDWLYEAGVPHSVLQLLLGRGTVVGTALSKAPEIAGVCFTGSTATAQTINRHQAEYAQPGAGLIAETGGLNAMIVDSTALPEQAVRDIVISAFQSAGQRCSACRVLFVQDDVADKMLKMLFGAVDALQIGNPWDFSTDVGPVIDATAQKNITDWVAQQREKGRVLKDVQIPSRGNFVSPTVIALDSLSELEQEIFGPVLHVIRYHADDLEGVIAAINATGYGLTFGMHSRIDDRVDRACQTVRAGNIYINRNQIGAVVGSQPFGGQGLSGTGPKAGGPLYLSRFYQRPEVPALPKEARLPGPTGESNLWSRRPRGKILCLGPTDEEAEEQARIVRAEGCEALLAPGAVAMRLQDEPDIVAAVYWGNDARAYRKALAEREGAIIPWIVEQNFSSFCWLERHICVDTTASGGNTELLV